MVSFCIIIFDARILNFSVGTSTGPRSDQYSTIDIPPTNISANTGGAKRKTELLGRFTKHSCTSSSSFSSSLHFFHCHNDFLYVFMEA